MGCITTLTCLVKTTLAGWVSGIVFNALKKKSETAAIFVAAQKVMYHAGTFVAQIATFGTMAARGAIRDVGRAMSFTFAETDVVAKLVPTMPLHITLKEALKVSPKLYGF